MRIEITQNPETSMYEYQVWDGPDGIDYKEGLELDLGQVFEQIIIFRTLNSQQYQEDFRPLCEELATELDKYVSMYSPEGEVLYRTLRILHKPPYKKEK
jgi:hypothetical protein